MYIEGAVFINTEWKTDASDQQQYQKRSALVDQLRQECHHKHKPSRFGEIFSLVSLCQGVF